MKEKEKRNSKLILGNDRNEQVAVEIFRCKLKKQKIKRTENPTVVTFFVNGGLVIWASHKQSVVALSTMEAEFIALAVACQRLSLATSRGHGGDDIGVLSWNVESPGGQRSRFRLTRAVSESIALSCSRALCRALCNK